MFSVKLRPLLSPGFGLQDGSRPTRPNTAGQNKEGRMRGIFSAGLLQSDDTCSPPEEEWKDNTVGNTFSLTQFTHHQGRHMRSLLINSGSSREKTSLNDIISVLLSCQWTLKVWLSVAAFNLVDKNGSQNDQDYQLFLPINYYWYSAKSQQKVSQSGWKKTQEKNNKVTACRTNSPVVRNLVQIQTAEGQRSPGLII